MNTEPLGQVLNERSATDGSLNKSLETLLSAPSNEPKDSFGLKLTQIGNEVPSNEKPQTQRKTKKSLKSDFQDSLSLFDKVMQEHLSREKDPRFKEVLQDLKLNFLRVQSTAQNLMEATTSPNKSPKKASPKKSPSKSKENDVPCEQISMFSSPTKSKPVVESGENSRRSNQRKRLQLDHPDLDEDYDAQTSPSKRSLPKSPVKRMQRLEDKEEQVDVETAYKSSQETQEEKKQEEEELPAKFLMASLRQCQEPV